MTRYVNGLIRSAVLANIVAAALLVIAMGLPAAALAPHMGAPDVRKVPGLDPSLTAFVNTLAVAYGILFAIGVLAIAPDARAGAFGALGAVVSALGDGLLAARNAWSLFAAGAALPFHPLIPPALIGTGAVIFGVAVFRARVLSRVGAILLAIFCPTGLFGLAGPAATTLLFGTDLGLAPSTLLRMYGYVSMFVVASAWTLLALSAWKLRPVHVSAPTPAIA